MGCFRVAAYQSADIRSRVISCVLAAIAILSPLAQAQSQEPADLATLQGCVRDSHNRPVGAASIHLQIKSGTQILTARTDLEGNYRFSALHQGNYILHAEMAGYDEATSGPFVLGRKEAKRIDLILVAAKESGPQNSSPGTPEFFDEPQFTVAGVTDPTNLGGHGSDTVLRTKETLAKETVALSGELPGSSQTASSPAATEKSLREAVEHGPENFEANHQLGAWLAGDGKSREAIPYLERASRLNPGDYGNSYELARAYADAGKYDNSRMTAQTLLTAPDKSEQHEAGIHHLLAEVNEKLRNPLEAVREYRRAAELNSSEPNLFDWGAELLLHRAAEPAIEVFSKGNRLYPRSVRMLVGLGVAWYARGSYDQAAQRLCQASDLDPDDPNPYLFLGKMLGANTTLSEDAVERLRRFARLQPENALANYYFALSLWKRRKGPEDTEHLAQVESLLQKAVHLDPKLAAGYLQLGILYSDRKDFPKAISAYQQTIAASPGFEGAGLEEAHYRLAQAYKQTGEKLKAQQELQLYEQISKKKEEEVERDRHDIQQFVYTLRDPSSIAQPH